MKTKLMILVLAVLAAVLSSEAAKKPAKPKSADELLEGAKKVWSQDFESLPVGACPYEAKSGTNDCFGVSDWRACSGSKALLVEPSFASAQPNDWGWSVSDFGGKLSKSMRGYVIVRFSYFCESPMSSWTMSSFSINFANEMYSYVRIALGGESNVNCALKTKSGGVKPKDKMDKLLPVGFGFPTQKAYRWYRYTAKVPVGRIPDANVSVTMEELGLDGKWKFLDGGCLSEPNKYTQAAKAELKISGPSSARWGSNYRALVDDLEVYVENQANDTDHAGDEGDVISLDE